MKYRVSQAFIGQEERLALLSVLDAGYFGMGPMVEQFEKGLVEYLDVPLSALSTCSTGTAALHLALESFAEEMGWPKNAEVLVPDITYCASLQACSMAGLKPVICDVEYNYLTISLDSMANNITNKTVAIMPVNYAGQTGFLEGVYQFASSNNLVVIEDAAHSFGSGVLYDRKESLVSNFAVCFSFDGIKNLTCGEGGAVVTSNSKVSDRIKDKRLLGVKGDTKARFLGERTSQPDITMQGWRYHLSELNAAMGIAQLSKFDQMAIRRRSLASEYSKSLSEYVEWFPKLSNPNHLSTGMDIPHIFPIVLPPNVSRSIMVDSLKNEHGIQTTVHYPLNSKLKFFTAPTGPNAKDLSDRILSLPLHPTLTTEDVNKISSHVISLL